MKSKIDWLGMIVLIANVFIFGYVIALLGFLIMVSFAWVELLSQEFLIYIISLLLSGTHLAVLWNLYFKQQFTKLNCIMVSIVPALLVLGEFHSGHFGFLRGIFWPLFIIGLVTLVWAWSRDKNKKSNNVDNTGHKLMKSKTDWLGRIVLTANILIVASVIAPLIFAIMSDYAWGSERVSLQIFLPFIFYLFLLVTHLAVLWNLYFKQQFTKLNCIIVSIVPALLVLGEFDSGYFDFLVGILLFIMGLVTLVWTWYQYKNKKF